MDTKQQHRSKLIDCWNAFAEAARSATAEEARQFEVIVTDGIYNSIMQDIKKKIKRYTFLVSSIPGTETPDKKLYAQFFRFYVDKFLEGKPADIKKQTNENLKMLAIRASVDARTMRSPWAFNTLTKNMRGLKRMAEEVAKRCDEIYWATEDGEPARNWDEYNYTTDPPPYEMKRVHWHQVIQEKFAEGSPRPLDTDTLPIYYPILVGGKPRWIRHGTNKDSHDEVIRFINDRDITAGLEELASPGMTANTRFATYCLVVKIDDSRINQLYVGEAAPGVYDRWFAKGESSHISHIRTAYRVSNDVPVVYPCEILLAANYAIHNTWAGNAALFVLNSSTDENSMYIAQGMAIGRFRATDMKYGLNKQVPKIKPPT